jgi:hypothetical protein
MYIFCTCRKRDRRDFLISWLVLAFPTIKLLKDGVVRVLLWEAVAVLWRFSKFQTEKSVFCSKVRVYFSQSSLKNWDLHKCCVCVCVCVCMHVWVCDYLFVLLKWHSRVEESQKPVYSHEIGLQHRALMLSWYVSITKWQKTQKPVFGATVRWSQHVIILS